VCAGMCNLVKNGRRKTLDMPYPKLVNLTVYSDAIVFHLSNRVNAPCSRCRVGATSSPRWGMPRRSERSGLGPASTPRSRSGAAVSFGNMTTPPRAEYAFNGDVAIAYGVTGEGPVDLVYIQGFVSHVELMWECPQAVAFFERIAQWARLITIDRRGTGMSDRFSARELPPLEDATGDVLAVMDAVGSKRASILGHHEGGQLGAMLAALHPDRVRTLSLVETAMSWRRAQEQIEPTSHGDEELADFIEGQRRAFGTRADEQDVYDLTAPSHAGDRTLYRFLSRLQRYAASPDSMVGFVTLLFQTDIEGILGSIGVPTQVLHRSEDRLLPVAFGRELADAIPGADFVELPGGDWWPFLGDTQPLLRALERFVLGATISRRSAGARTLATVMFTDIVGSTARSATLGDEAWGRLRREHDEIVRRALAEFGGREVKTMGDGFLATFDGPARGVECAVQILRETAELGIELRAGLHTGEVSLEDDDVTGIAVSIGARVVEQAGANDVLVSQTVRDLVAGSRLTFDDTGEHELKGVPNRWHLYKVADQP
jgi:class 3 adenylate cyclase/pimeloyl-ACP methyl ester carboxylesterase